MFGIVRKLTFYFSTIDSLLLSYSTLVRSKLEQVSSVCNNVMATNANKLERVQWQLAALYFTCFSSHIPWNYACALQLLKLHTSQVRKLHCDVLFFINVF